MEALVKQEVKQAKEAEEEVLRFKMNYKTISFIILTLIILGSIVLAGNTDTIYFENTDDQNVNHVNFLLYKCSDSECSSKNVIFNLDSGSNNYVNYEYPSTAFSYYAARMYNECYLPYADIYDNSGDGGIFEWTYHLEQAENCHSPIDSFSITNENYANEPVIINMRALLEADAQSPFRPTEHYLGDIPSGYEDFYSAETTATLEILNNQDQVVYTDYVDLNILMDTSEEVHYEWTPTEAGEYTARITTDVTDCQCSSSFEEYAEKVFTVFPERPKDEGYTIINNLVAAPDFPFEEDLVTITFDKISNYADNDHVKTPVPTRVDYEIKLGTATVFSDNLLLPANPNAEDPVEFSFQWTPSSGGLYDIIVIGVAEDPLVVGKNNPSDTSSISYFVEGMPEPPVCLFNADCGTDGFEGDGFCIIDDLYMDYREYTCNNPGESDAYCSNEVEARLVEVCEYGCADGYCLPKPPVCEIDLDCGEDYYGDRYCNPYENVVRDHFMPICTIFGICDMITETELVEVCDYGCLLGECLPEPPVCEIDADCGEPYYGEKYCEGDSVVRDLFTPVCDDGTCGLEVTTELVKECDDDCKNGKCVKDEDDDRDSTGITQLFFECVPEWQCGGWSSCYDGIKTRTCEDLNHCETVFNEPITSVGCQTQVIEPVMKERFNWLWFMIAILIFLVLLILFIYFGWR
ncbi:MAG: hypothetical protein ABIB79_05620 [archaeon]